MYELNHVQEAMAQLEEHVRDPYSITGHAEQVCMIEIIARKICRRVIDKLE